MRALFQDLRNVYDGSFDFCLPRQVLILTFLELESSGVARVLKTILVFNFVFIITSELRLLVELHSKLGEVLLRLWRSRLKEFKTCPLQGLVFAS